MKTKKPQIVRKDAADSDAGKEVRTTIEQDIRHQTPKQREQVVSYDEFTQGTTIHKTKSLGELQARVMFVDFDKELLTCRLDNDLRVNANTLWRSGKTIHIAFNDVLHSAPR